MDKYLRDRRLVERHSVSVPLRYRTWKSSVRERLGESLNISECGIYFSTRDNLEKGEIVELRFELPDKAVAESKCEWACTGRVVRVERSDSPIGMLRAAVHFACYEVNKPHRGATTGQIDTPLSAPRLPFKTGPCTRTTL